MRTNTCLALLLGLGLLLVDCGLAAKEQVEKKATPEPADATKKKRKKAIPPLDPSQLANYDLKQLIDRERGQSGNLGIDHFCGV